MPRSTRRIALGAMPMLVERIAYRAAQRLRVSLVFRPEMAERAADRRYAGAARAQGAHARPRAHPRRSAARCSIRTGATSSRASTDCPRASSPTRSRRCARPGAIFADLRRVDARRRADANDEIFRATPPGRYPRYYLQNFHYQTDGWLSRPSAELYDHQVEVLFGGGADAMRRQALVPLRTRAAPSAACAARRCSISPAAPGASCARSRATTRSWRSTALDLSPHYLELAREALAPWSGTAFIEAPAEAVPLPDAELRRRHRDLPLPRAAGEDAAPSGRRKWRGCCARRRGDLRRFDPARRRAGLRRAASNISRTPSTSPITRNMRVKIWRRCSPIPGSASKRAGSPISPR